MSTEPPTTTGALARLGFSSTDRVRRFLAEPALEGLGAGAAKALGATADGDDAVLGLLRLSEAALEAGQTACRGVPRGVGPPAPGAEAHPLLGTSVALGDFLARHPERLSCCARGTTTSVPPKECAMMLEASAPIRRRRCPSPPGGREVRDALRVAYHHGSPRSRRRTSRRGPDALQPRVSAPSAIWPTRRSRRPPPSPRATVEGHEKVRWAVIALGKTGARELNYISDVDVMHVVAPAREDLGDGDELPPEVEEDMITIGSALARELARACSERTGEGSLWQVDANLRPEGKDGPLVRTIASYRRYYTQWAKSWEFQALLKARAAAGDRALGRDFEQMVEPWVWQASTREGFVEDARAMRRRVVAHIPRAEVERNLKLGPGGLRDVEFTVQLLQMVHGRADEAAGPLHPRRPRAPRRGRVHLPRPRRGDGRGLPLPALRRAPPAAAPAATHPGAAHRRLGPAPARAQPGPVPDGFQALPAHPPPGAAAARGDLLPPRCC